MTTLAPCRLPARAGVGFKPEHFTDISGAPQPLGFFEIHAENYMGAGGPPHARLAALRERYALSIHGVGLSIGSPQPLDRTHLSRLQTLCARYEPESFSEHLAWSSHGEVYYNDLLPLPYTEETLARIVEHVDLVQSTLKREMLLENPSTYLRFGEQTDDAGAPLLIDAHGSPVVDAVWALFEDVIARTGALPTLIEWDNDVPEWPVLLGEAKAAQAILDRAARPQAA
jgi:uncharacterized protein (UPF0276 family)